MVRVALYARASTDEQTHSTSGQIQELRQYADSEGLEIVAEIEDKGEKRHTLDRPGIDQLRELCESGEVSEVWAWEWSRYGEFPMPETLTMELEDFGVRLRSLDDGGGGENGYEMNVIKSLFSRREQRDRVRRIKRGKSDKARRGEIDVGGRAKYGFEFVRDGKGKAVGYAVSEQTMCHVRRIFDMVAEGSSLYSVCKALESDRIASPAGKQRWSAKAIRDIIGDDAYNPHPAAELESMVSMILEPDHVYGVNWSGRKRSQFKSSRSKDRVVYHTSREEQVPVPVDLTGSGLDRGTVERAREAIKDNKQPSKVGGRFWELSGGILTCAHCGKHMIAYSRKSRDERKVHTYYRCRYGTLPDFECPNRKSHRAEELETRAWLGVYETATDPEGALVQALTETYEERKRSLGSGGAAKRSALIEMLATIETKRRNYWNMAASGDIPLEAMREEVAKLDEEKSGIESELEATKDTAEQLEALEGWYESLKQTLQWEEDWDIELGLDLGENEERHKLYKRLGINFTVDENGTLEAGWQIKNLLQERSNLKISTAASPSPRA